MGNTNLKTKKDIKTKHKVKNYNDDSDGELIVFNDDFNTFVKVITTLMVFCNLDAETAERYTIKIHNEGECSVLKDKKSKLFPICENINESGILAEIR